MPPCPVCGKPAITPNKVFRTERERFCECGDDTKILVRELQKLQSQVQDQAETIKRILDGGYKI